MSTFTIRATLIHPEHRERAVTADFLVDTGALYSLLPAEIVERLGLTAEEDFEALLANGEPAALSTRVTSDSSPPCRATSDPHPCPSPQGPQGGGDFGPNLYRGFLFETYPAMTSFMVSRACPAAQVGVSDLAERVARVGGSSRFRGYSSDRMGTFTAPPALLTAGRWRF